MKPTILDPDADKEPLDVIYEQIAGFMLEISRIPFTNIRAISKDTASGVWSVASRPLTYDMNEIVTVGGCSAKKLSTKAKFDRASEHFWACAHMFQFHAGEQRNISGFDEDIAGTQFIVRHRFPKLVPIYSTVDDAGPFRLFCDDLRPSNPRLYALLAFSISSLQTLCRHSLPTTFHGGYCSTPRLTGWGMERRKNYYAFSSQGKTNSFAQWGGLRAGHHRLTKRASRPT